MFVFSFSRRSNLLEIHRFLPPNSLELAKEFAHVSGYELEDTPYNSSFGGFRDWFIKNFNKPGFTIEVRKR